MMRYSERRARDRAAQMTSRSNVGESVASAVGSLQRELAQTVALALELQALYQVGQMSATTEREIWAWAQEAVASFNGVAVNLRKVSGSLSGILASATAT